MSEAHTHTVDAVNALCPGACQGEGTTGKPPAASLEIMNQVVVALRVLCVGF